MISHPDKITQKIDYLLRQHPEFLKLYRNNPTVHAWLKTAMTYNDREYIGSAEDILVGIIVELARENKQMRDRELKRMQEETRRA